MEYKKKIDNKQFGFRKQRSTIDAISKVTKIIDRFKRKEKAEAIFFDIEKTKNNNKIKCLFQKFFSVITM